MRRFGRSLADVAEPLDGPWASRLAEIAEQHGVVVVAGMFTPADDGRVTNTLRVVGPGVDAHYDKIHLFDAFGFAESDTVAPGTEPLVIRLGDLGRRFRHLLRHPLPRAVHQTGRTGAQLICVPASWGAGPGKIEQWQLLIRARALDSTSYLAAAGQADPTTVGQSTGSAPTGVGSQRGGGAGRHRASASLGAEPGRLLVDMSIPRWSPPPAGRFRCWRTAGSEARESARTSASD